MGWGTISEEVGASELTHRWLGEWKIGAIIISEKDTGLEKPAAPRDHFLFPPTWLPQVGPQWSIQFLNRAQSLHFGKPPIPPRPAHLTESKQSNRVSSPPRHQRSSSSLDLGQVGRAGWGGGGVGGILRAGTKRTAARYALRPQVALQTHPGAPHPPTAPPRSGALLQHLLLSSKSHPTPHETGVNASRIFQPRVQLL